MVEDTHKHGYVKQQLYICMCYIHRHGLADVWKDVSAAH